MGLKGKVRVPGDKSMTHRAFLFGGIANGTTTISNALEGADCLASLKAVEALGAKIERSEKMIQITGTTALNEAQIDCGNSGTTIRLLSGILAGSEAAYELTGDDSLKKRPMDRVTIPLSQLGAKIEGNYAPLRIQGQPLVGTTYTLPVASAQVKSAVLLAGLFATGETTVIEPILSRDHTERMLPQFGVDVTIDDFEDGRHIRVEGPVQLTATTVDIPGDPSSAAFWWTAAAIGEDSVITTERVLMNPTRIGFLQVLRQMGASVKISNRQEVAGEEVADVTVESTSLQAMTIEGEQIPSLIDEIPLLALLATQAEGKTIIRDAAELRVKETDRIETVVASLRRLGASIEATADGMTIEGPTSLKGAEVDSAGDHRLAMMLTIAKTLNEEIQVNGNEVVEVSYPTFYDDLKKLQDNGNG
ncbi:3-phosphoshikimate 1-carboxyvinyltransferase [Exiguobacterium oxidotolerans]|uniref:3-phosphoshikimate 1-carboxyvinyltransferase n=1 Tax=Exiguobacterium oxidotolerans TaxID=223958 RepID=A0A653ID31_9BACL|nr:3-phosphoshikimate 1-carboxyvinyltransferase [Exiguobacterium oxidotolerans]VWX37010.1 3-phosphoshikimate 1-carboxyvinyltransferase (5-enolpyruvoylshikimate-3-phosphate synthase) [Exiguobacterium oxidotolerans]